MKRIHLPETIRVGPFDFEIAECPNLSSSKEELMGDFSGLFQRIRIDTAVERQTQVDTMLHELGHAIYWAYSLRDKDDEEQTVRVQATAWTQIYQDNPQLLDWIKFMLQK